MNECICSSCRNLKGMPDENGAVEQYECAFGFPSDACSDCEDNECELTCPHYICDDEQDTGITLKCKLCGKELQQTCSSDEEGEVYCMSCYLKNMEM